ncbi:MAG: alpha/beta fold hydrolase [Leeuwenhoekiella sp.]
MKIISRLLLVLSLLLSSMLTAQEITGEWSGNLEVQGMKLPLVINITQRDSGYASTLKSPKQSPLEMPVDQTHFENDSLYISVKRLQLHFRGKLENQMITGNFIQMGNTLPLTLQHKSYEEEKRPQDPTGELPYIAEEVTFKNAAANNIKLAGTLTLPMDIKNPPVAVLITGSGGQNRDEELGPMNHRPFLVLADHLTREGIAVLRFDDRGVGESEGNQQEGTSADFATDVEAAVTYLKTRTDVDISKIGLIGHSEGGLIADLVIANKNNKIAYFVSLAGPAVPGGEIIISQTEKIAQLNGEDAENTSFDKELSSKIFEYIATAKDTLGMGAKVSNVINSMLKNAPKTIQNKYTPEIIASAKDQFLNNWMIYFIQTDPATYIEQIEIPTLVLNGGKDVQVLSSLNLPAYEQALKKAGNQDYTIKELPELNHLFQTAETGNPMEYGQIEETFSPQALELISSWINKRF